MLYSLIPTSCFILSWLDLLLLYLVFESLDELVKSLQPPWGFVFEKIQSVTNCTDVEGFQRSTEVTLSADVFR